MFSKINRAFAKSRSEDGFTLIELLIVIVIIGILAAIAIPVFLNAQNAAHDATVKSDARNTVIGVATALVTKPDATGFSVLAAGDTTASVKLAGVPSVVVTVPPGAVAVRAVVTKSNWVTVRGTGADYVVHAQSTVDGFWYEFKSKTGKYASSTDTPAVTPAVPSSLTPASNSVENPNGIAVRVTGDPNTDSTGGGTGGTGSSPVPAAINPLATCRTPLDPGANLVSTAAALTSAFNTGGPISLGADLSLEQLTAAYGKTTTLDLNGHNLTLAAASSPAITVPENATFVLNNNVVAGTLSASTSSLSAAALGGPTAGKILINCGTVNATTTGMGAAIGGNYNSTFQSVAINGGIINAQGGSFEYRGDILSGAAIGSGDSGYGASTVTINGGVVTATAGYITGVQSVTTGYARGPKDIGTGTGRNNPTVSVVLNGGVVNGAQFPVTNGAFFKAGNASDITRALRATSQLPGASPSTIRMTADVQDNTGFFLRPNFKATLDLNSHTVGVAISGQGSAINVPADATFAIEDRSSGGGGTLNASTTSQGAAAIGGETSTETGHIIINSGTVNASTIYVGAAIGGSGSNVSFQSVDINGGSVNASSGVDAEPAGQSYYQYGGAAIGGGAQSYGGGIVNITGGTVHATAGSPLSHGLGRGYPSGAVTVNITGGNITSAP